MDSAGGESELTSNSVLFRRNNNRYVTYETVSVMFESGTSKYALDPLFQSRNSPISLRVTRPNVFSNTTMFVQNSKTNLYDKFWGRNMFRSEVNRTEFYRSVKEIYYYSRYTVTHVNIQTAE